jgi:ubiquinone/menaquinone biosynthesis C-methylase UbiE
MPQKIVNYDGYDYDYSTYWEGREYENNAEHIVLRKLLDGEHGNWFIDIGGSYGRLTDTYADRYKHCVILDYSFKTLVKNQDMILERFPNTILISANAYKMPFREDVFDGGLMVRVLHHIEKQKEYFDEVSRIFKEDGIYIQEFANKIHMKARIRALLSGDKEFTNQKPYQQPCINLEGAKGDGVYFLNYHPKHIKELLKESGFDIEEKIGCSYFRIPLLKRILGSKILTFFEKISQRILGKTDIPPSIFIKAELDEGEEGQEYKELKDVLVCPSCKGDFEIAEEGAKCRNCGKEYIKEKGVWDFRVD